MLASRVVVATLALSLASCGYVASGEWEDDPDNWSRAYSADPPEGLEILRSRYWRSAHFTQECAFHFEIAPNDEIERQLLDAHPTRQLEGGEAREAMSTLGREPEWFTPRPWHEYEVWTYVDDPTGNFRLFIARDTRALFLAGGQL
jgi:hypothetical protein